MGLNIASGWGGPPDRPSTGPKVWSFGAVRNFRSPGNRKELKETGLNHTVSDVTNCDCQRTQQQCWTWYQDRAFWKLNAHLCLGKGILLTPVGRGYKGSILPTGCHTPPIFCNKAIIICVILSSLSHSN